MSLLYIRSTTITENVHPTRERLLLVTLLLTLVACTKSLSGTYTDEENGTKLTLTSNGHWSTDDGKAGTYTIDSNKLFITGAFGVTIQCDINGDTIITHESSGVSRRYTKNFATPDIRMRGTYINSARQAQLEIASSTMLLRVGSETVTFNYAVLGVTGSDVTTAVTLPNVGAFDMVINVHENALVIVPNSNHAGGLLGEGGTWIRK